MHAIEERYYEINRIFLKILGLWPYQHSYLALVQKMLYGGIFFTFMIVQLLAFLTMQFSTNLLLKILSIVFPTLFVVIKYFTFVIQADKVKQLLEQIRDDLNLLKDKMEIDIINKYSDNTKFLTLLSIVFCHFGIFCYVILQFLPLMLDIIIPLNASRSLKPIAIMEYFVNREKYIYTMILHEMFTFYIGMLTVCSTGATIMMYILHGCALFKIVSYRMENIIQEDMLVLPNPVKQYILHQRIVHAVFIHQKSILFYEFAISSFVLSFAFLIVIGVTSLSFNLFHLLQLMTVSHDIREISLIFILIILHVNYMFVVNYGGEKIQNHGMDLFKATYNGLWYAAPLRTQKMILFIMQKTTIKITLTCGNIFVASLEGFVTLINTAISYFTLIYSTR